MGNLSFYVKDRVKHNKFGEGIVVEIVNNDVVIVEFDNEFEGKKDRKIKSTFLSLIKRFNNEEKTIAPDKLKVGDKVHHDRYGDGFIISMKGFFRAIVKFENEEVSVLIDDLKKIDFNIIDDDELIEEVKDSSFKIIPSNYSEQNYSTSAKRLLTYLRKKYPNEGIATIKSYEENGGSIGVIISPSKGIVVFKMMTVDLTIEALQSPLFEELIKNEYIALKKYYINAFLQSKKLCDFIDDSYKIMKFPLKFVMVYQKVDILKMTSEQRKSIALKNKNIYFKNFSTIFENNDLMDNFEKCSSNFSKIDESFFGAIIERAVPENATLIDIAPSQNKTIVSKCNNPEFTPITGKEREFSALYLDDNQIRIINDTKPGYYLTLANPGTGKSVLLVSKAYRIQSSDKHNNVLITCYNRNLAEHHNVFAEVSGMKTPQLHIFTFHKLVIDLLDKYDHRFLENNSLDDDYDENFNKGVLRLEEFIDKGIVKTNLNAIFIDEIQLFEPKWIDICYKLLDREDNKDYFFEMFGDINQDVKIKQSKGKASWNNTKFLPSLQGRVKKLDKNYRNTDLIANYLKCVILEFNEFLSKHGMPVDNESACLSSETIRKGSLRTKILRSSTNDVSKIAKTIIELVSKKKADYTEIAIVYPMKKYGKFYTPVKLIEEELELNEIPFSFIHGNTIYGPEAKKKIFECDGVVMSTIDSCLGLDFKYVILCGLHSLDFYFDEKKNKSEQINTAKILFDFNAKSHFNEAGKKIYSACSRAREGLYIIDDLNDDSPIKTIIRPRTGGKYYDEY